jgi:hypothetical protein
MKHILRVVSVSLTVLFPSSECFSRPAGQEVEQEPLRIGINHNDIQVELVNAAERVVARIQHKAPAKEASLEYSPEFRKAAAEAWQKVQYGNRPRPEQGSPEAGFTIGRDGKPSAVKVATKESGPGEMRFVTDPDTLAVFHTHSDPWIRRPSTRDQALAKNNHRQIYTATKDGLFLTGPDGKTTQVFRRADWATKKNPQ